MQEYAIIVAGGKGIRMESDTPKQFLLLSGMPVLMHTISAFFDYSKKIKIVIGLPQKEISTWKSLIEEYSFKIPHEIIAGGDTRFQTVRNCLNSISAKKGLVAIHDGVRPLVTEKMIASSFQLAATHGTAIAAVRMKESIRLINQNQTQSVDRSKYRLIQTPQTFKLDLLKEAYKQKEESMFTDDASVVEKMGTSIALYEGDYKNIKITTPEDLQIVKLFLDEKDRN